MAGQDSDGAREVRQKRCSWLARRSAALEVNDRMRQDELAPGSTVKRHSRTLAPLRPTLAPLREARDAGD